MLDVVIEILLCAIIVLGFIIGMKRGFINLAAKPLKTIAAVVVAFCYCSVIASSVVTPWIEAPIASYIKDFMYENCASLTSENVNEELPTLIKIAAATFGIDISEVAGNATVSVIDAVVENLTAPVVSIISNIISFVGLFIVSVIIFGIVLWLLNVIFSRGIFGLFNKLIGTIFGTAFSVLAAWGIAVIIEIVFRSPIFAENELIAAFEGGYVYKFFNTYNPIELLLSF